MRFADLLSSQTLIPKTKETAVAFPLWIGVGKKTASLWENQRLLSQGEVGKKPPTLEN